MKTGSEERFHRDSEALKRSGLPFINGNLYHFIIKTEWGEIDFWPSSGKYHHRAPKAPYLNGGINGVFTLVERLSNGAWSRDGKQTATPAVRHRTRPLQLVASEGKLVGDAAPVAPPVDPALTVSNADIIIQWEDRISHFSTWVLHTAGFTVVGAPEHYYRPLKPT